MSSEYIVGFPGSLDPITGQNVYPSSGNLHMIEPLQTSPKRDWEKRVDVLWVEANNTTNEDQRKSAFQEIQGIWIDEAPWIYTTSGATITTVAEEYGNIYPNPGTGMIGIAHRLYVR